MAILEGAGNVPQQAFVQYNDPQGTKLIALNRDGTIYTRGVRYPDGNTVQAINTTVPQSLSITAAETALYAVSIYMSAAGTAAAGHTYTTTLTYTAANGMGVQTINLVLP